MDEEDRGTSICYGTHAYSRKEVEFIHAELSEQVQVGYVAVFSL